MRARIPFAALAIAGVIALVGCATEEPAQSAQPQPRPTASPSPTVDAAPTVFTQPALCSEALPLARIADFESERGLVLLGGPEGRYGLGYSLDPSPEERAGGITCIWGYSDTEVSAVTVSVAPLTAANRAAVVAQLTDQGLNESVEGTATTFWQKGDTVSQPAILNVLGASNWISVIVTIGGNDAYDDAVAIATEVAETVTRPAT